MDQLLTQRMLANAWYHHSTQALFNETCQRRAGHPAIVFDGTEITFGALKTRVDALSMGLMALGVGRGDVVSTLPSPTPEFAALYLATLQVGAVVNPLNLLWGVEELAGVLPRNNPRLIVTVDEYAGRDYLALLHEALPDLELGAQGARSATVPALRRMVTVSRQGRRHTGLMDFDELAVEPTAGWRSRLDGRLAEARPTDIQFMCQTSGTTGLSKSALWDHRPPLATVNFGARNMGYTPEERYMNLAPFYHNSGITALNLNLVYAGSTLILMERFDPAEALRLIERYRATSTFGFDAHFQAMRREPSFDPERFTIDKLMLAGEPRTYDLVRSMCPAGATINNLYAQTENGPLVSLGEHDCMDERLKKYTHGRPVPGVEVVIKDIDTGEPVPQGTAGEICYRSPFLFRGYHSQPEEVEKAFDDDGYFHSGDFGHLDAGYVTFLGRLGGVIKSGGENVSTVRVTNLLLERFPEAFDDVKALGVPDEYWGTMLVAFVRPAEGHSLAPTRELRAQCKGHLADYEIPRAFLPWTDAWPTTPEGKIDFKRLQRDAEEQLKPA
ncbi:acyl--CoA ligase [Ectothiorhodospiraceae bacterium WFHF3C12]|nr:acyl--CoA ligase [Ectothiorhodospiraceae bacterium WFHF3C12]